MTNAEAFATLWILSGLQFDKLHVERAASEARELVSNRAEMSARDPGEAVELAENLSERIDAAEQQLVPLADEAGIVLPSQVRS